MRKTIQKAIVWQEGRIQLVHRELLEPSFGEVMLRLDATALCSSDFHIWSGLRQGKLGVLGHEGSGTVVAVGPGVSAWEPGEFAVVNPLLNCGECPDCRAGRGHICQSREIIGYNGKGLLADVQLLEARSLFRPPENLPRWHACLVEPLACVIHAQRMLDPSAPGDSMLILGCGPMGAMHAAYAKVRGVSRVWIADPDPSKLTLARSQGVPCDAWIPFEEVHDRVNQLTDGRGAAITVLANSSYSSHELAFRLTAHRGQVLLFSSIRRGPMNVRVEGQDVECDIIHARESRENVSTRNGLVTAVGSMGFDLESFRESALMLTGIIDGGQFITATRQLADIPKLARGEWKHHLKIVIYPSGEPVSDHGSPGGGITQ